MKRIRILKVEVTAYTGTAEAANEESIATPLAGVNYFNVAKLQVLYDGWEKKEFEMYVPSILHDVQLPPKQELAILEKRELLHPDSTVKMHSWATWYSGKIRHKPLNLGQSDEFYVWYEIVITPTLVYHH